MIKVPGHDGYTYIPWLELRRREVTEKGKRKSVQKYQETYRLYKNGARVATVYDMNDFNETIKTLESPSR